MASPLQILAGLMITNVVELHGYIQLHFGNDIGLSIYNEITVDPASMHVDQLIGKMVSSIAERDKAIEIIFLDETRIVVDMHRQAYRGPEALQLNQNGLPPVIWN